MSAILHTIPAGMLESLRPALEQAYVRDPKSYREPIEVFAALRGVDPGSIALAAARRAIREGSGAILVGQALALAKDEVIRIESANLAVAVSTEDRRGLEVLNEAAERTAEHLLAGSVEAPPSLAFVQSTWRRFAMAMVVELERASRSEKLAVEKVAELEAEVERLQSLETQRLAALNEARAEAGAQGRASVSTLAAGALRPVAAAVADSYESKSLEALQDRLEGLLLRAGISIAIKAGETVSFDPTRQRWVGEGDPPEIVRALSPAIVTRGEGNEETVVVPARVVADR